MRIEEENREIRLEKRLISVLQMDFLDEKRLFFSSKRGRLAVYDAGPALQFYSRKGLFRVEAIITI